MFQVIEVCIDKLRHLILNPPLAPGSGGVAIDDESNSNSRDDPLILRYLPLLVLLTLFWPVLLTFIAASISASGWLIWLFVGATFGTLQLIYVLYNFIMIIWDVSALTILKSLALLRSFFRYYFFKMTNAAGIDIKGSNSKHSKKRRRKEWREEVDRAKTFKEYSLIELYEPQQQQLLQTQNSAKSTVTKKPKTILRRYVSTGSSTPLGRLRKRIVKSPPPSSPTKKQQPQGSPSSPMRRIQSSHTFAEGSGSSRRGSAAFRRSTSTNNENDSQQFQPLRRVSSTILLGESNDDEEDDENIDGNSCPKWQRVVKEDLGMAGSMLLTTVSRLKEARMQASSMNNNNNNDRMSSEQQEEDEKEDDDPQCNDEPTGHLRASSQTFHITSFSSSSSSNKQHNKIRREDYSSSLKTLLSGIVKRNHLSVDDFLLQDARSIAERGQHSLRKETREAIDRYGEEVDKCLEWVASGAVYLGGDGGDDENENAHGNNTQKKVTTNAQEQIMQRQQNELSKRYTLFKR